MQRIKKEKSFSKKYWPVVVYLDELREIVDTMSAHCKSVEFSSDEYIFASLDDAKEHFGNKPQTRFKIKGSEPYSYVEYARMTTEVYVSPGANSAQLYHEMDELLARQQRTLPFLYSGWVWLLSMVPNAITALLGKAIGDTGTIALTAFSIVASIWFLYVTYVSGVRHSWVTFQRRTEVTTFLEQNRNAIMMSILTAVISGGVGYGFAKLKEAPPVLCPPTASEGKRG